MTPFSTIKHPKRRTKLAALMLPLPTKTTTEEKTKLALTDAVPCTTEDHKLFKNKLNSRIKTHHS